MARKEPCGIFPTGTSSPFGEKGGLPWGRHGDLRAPKGAQGRRSPPPPPPPGGGGRGAPPPPPGEVQDMHHGGRHGDLRAPRGVPRAARTPPGSFTRCHEPPGNPTFPAAEQRKRAGAKLVRNQLCSCDHLRRRGGVGTPPGIPRRREDAPWEFHAPPGRPLDLSRAAMRISRDLSGILGFS